MTTPNEQELLAELERFEKSTLAKGGDALQSAPHDGGFATEGTNIQTKAKAIKKAMKALIKGGMSKSEAKKTVKALYKSDTDSSSSASSMASSLDKAFDGDGDSDDASSMDSGDEASSGDADSMSSDSASSGDDASSAASSAAPKKGKFGKSIGASQLADARSAGDEKKTGELRKALSDEANGAVDAVPVLAELTASIEKLAKSTSKSTDKELRKSIEQMESKQTAFNNKVAKALTIIAKSQRETADIVKKMADQPVVNDRRGNLHKSDIVEPQFHGNGTQAFDGRGEASPLMGVEFLKIQETLVDLVMKGQADPMDVTKFENAKGNLSVLPANVVKQLETRLCAAS